MKMDFAIFNRIGLLRIKNILLPVLFGNKPLILKIEK